MVAVAITLLVLLLAFFATRELRERYFFPSRIKRAEQLFKEGQVESALGMVKGLEARHKNQIELQWLKARIEAGQGHYLLAIVTLNDILRSDAFTQAISEDRVRTELAAVYEKGGRKREALTEYFLLTERNPQFYEGNLKVGRYHLEKKQYPDAERFLKQAHVSNKKAVEPALLLARLFQETSRSRDSEPFLKAILMNQPQHEEALYRNGLNMLDRGDVESAREAFRATQAVGGAFGPEAMAQEAFCAIELGNPEDAAALLENAVPVLPDGRPLLKKALEELFRLNVQLHRLERIEEVINRYGQAFPQDPWPVQKRDVFRHVLNHPDVRDFFASPTAEVLRKMRQILEERGYILDEARVVTDTQVIMRMTKQVKGFQKQHELFSISLMPELVGRTQMMEWTKTMKQDQIRTLIAVSPYDFTTEAQIYVKPMSVVLINGERMSAFLGGTLEW